MAVISMKALLESGVHFGHRTNKWDPRMKPYIFTERNGIHIIDLQQTVKLLNHAYNLIRDTVSAGGVVLFVGTKRQAQDTVKEEAERCSMPYVTERWLGGMLTNWSTMYARSRSWNDWSSCVIQARLLASPRRKACSFNARSTVCSSAYRVFAR